MRSACDDMLGNDIVGGRCQSQRKVQRVVVVEVVADMGGKRRVNKVELQVGAVIQ